MLVVLSPAKTLDMSACAVAAGIKASTPGMLTAAHQLLPVLQSKTSTELKSLFGVSDAIAKLNHERFRDFHSLPTKPAVFAFDGPAYKGLSATTLSAPQRDYCQQHLCVLNFYPPPRPRRQGERDGSPRRHRPSQRSRRWP
jgi:cytoplasmic iron level regulating protein YaaA (DUF328/UPF0246 family)